MRIRVRMAAEFAMFPSEARAVELAPGAFFVSKREALEYTLRTDELLSLRVERVPAKRSAGGKR